MPVIPPFAPSFFKPSKADFVPKRREISAVTNALQAEVTTTEDHDYPVGQLVRLHVPEDYGMLLDTVKGVVLTVPTPTTFTVDVDTTQLATYATPSVPPAFSQSHVVPIDGITENEAA